MEMRLRSFKQLPGEVLLEHVMQWWEWARDKCLDGASLQRASGRGYNSGEDCK